jgi:hypothetical protein
VRLLLLPVLIIAAVTTSRDITIIGRDERNPESGRVLVPHVAPIIYVRQTSGEPLPEKGSISCTWREEVTDGLPKVIGDCAEGVQVVVTGIDLNY